ncbi:hypothetical protein E2P81_ATG03841 [Venturia nashicola]|uniref:Uncharacterized protein n=1 Tax=Venturia nashicola TaxID=86259 RepID=A0A4Z1PSK2_9PEZI|nr:hypothetical protein E6O75_ATG03935 [Venturia nashicola]TLD38166.1 hypothetical protein E2P81_ATG03841 [Venturia nashicola]
MPVFQPGSAGPLIVFERKSDGEPSTATSSATASITMPMSQEEAAPSMNSKESWLIPIDSSTRRSFTKIVRNYTAACRRTRSHRYYFERQALN